MYKCRNRLQPAALKTEKVSRTPCTVLLSSRYLGRPGPPAQAAAQHTLRGKAMWAVRRGDREVIHMPQGDTHAGARPPETSRTRCAGWAGQGAAGGPRPSQ